MSGFKKTWRGNEIQREERDAAKRALNGTAADTVTLCQSPAPVGWPRRTGFLAGSTNFEAAVETPTGIIAKVVARANYSIYVNAKTNTLNRNGDTMARTIGERIREELQ